MTNRAQVFIPVEGLDCAKVESSFRKKLDSFGFKGVIVDAVMDDGEGCVEVSFSDLESESCFCVIFMLDSFEEGAVAVLLDASEDDDSFVTTVELNDLSPTTLSLSTYKYVDLYDLSWMDKATLTTILTVNDFFEEEDPVTKAMDSYGNIAVGEGVLESRLDGEGYDFTDEGIYLDLYEYVESSEGAIHEVAYRTAVKGGKKVRLAIVRRRRRKRLSSAVRAAMSRAARKSARNPATKRKRKRSVALRSKMHIKKRKKRKGWS